MSLLPGTSSTRGGVHFTRIIPTPGDGVMAAHPPKAKARTPKPQVKAAIVSPDGDDVDVVEVDAPAPADKVDPTPVDEDRAVIGPATDIPQSALDGPRAIRY